MAARKLPRCKTINGVPHIRSGSGAYQRIHQIVGGILDGAVQIKTRRRRWKFIKGPRRKAILAALPPAMLKPPALPQITVPTRPPGLRTVLWPNKYLTLTTHRP